MSHSAEHVAHPLHWWELALARAMVVGLLLAIGWIAIAERPSVGIATPANIPVAEPLELKPVPMDEARTINAATPFTTAPVPAARPYRFSGSPEDQGRAIDCLAAAIHYEAGNETLEGQQAVAQVILNRARHPAYPSSICAVVFQGSERRTGCQFTFTCDGAMARPVSAASWSRARQVATMMLAGTVYAPVGLATHYHTDWVLPAWSAKLDKVRAEGTHLFFRWSGYWGTPRAFRTGASASEPGVAKMAALSPFHAGAASFAVGDAAPAGALEVAVAPSDPAVSGAISQRDSFILVVDGASNPSALAAMALQKCGSLDYCKVMAWTRRADAPTGFPVPEANLASLSFSYLRNRSQGFEKPLWNCTVFKTVEKRSCMRGRTGSPAKSAPIPAINPAPEPSANGV